MIVAAFDYRWLRTFAWPLYFANLGLLAGSLVIGDGVGGVARWVTVFGLQFQFSEIAKILMIVVLANWIASRPAQRMGRPWTIVGAGLLVAPAMVLVLIQPDLGTSLVFVRHPRRHALPVRREPALAGASSAPSGWPRCRSSGTTSCATTRSSA